MKPRPFPNPLPVTRRCYALAAALSFPFIMACTPSRVPAAVDPAAADAIHQPASESNLVFDQMYQNPVIGGTSPDPSICKAGDSYYLVTSSFEYFPGVPIYQSKDLVHWQQIGHVLDRESQLQMRTLPSSQGVYAPTLRYHEGTFYMVTTNMSGGGSFFVTATDPAGPWSEPIWVRENVFTMDPSLFFDDDGKVYYTRHGEQRHGAIFQAEIDVKSGALDRVPQKIWSGTGDIWPEGPHVYKVAGKYYLMISEGGTSYDHMVTMARSDSPWGPFEAAPNNPMLTHRKLRSLPIQATGHADLVQTDAGQWWMVFLGIRPSTPGHHHIGRETFLTPVEWGADGWLNVNHDLPVALSMSVEGLPKLQPFASKPTRETFAHAVGVHWQHVRAKDPNNYTLTERPGYLRLIGTNTSLSVVGVPTAMVEPQRFLKVDVSAEVEFEAEPGQRGGLIVRGNEKNHYALLIEGTPTGREASLVATIDGVSRTMGTASLSEGPVTLRISGALDEYTFYVKQGTGPEAILGRAPTTSFAYERTQSFTGAYVGLYAHQDEGVPPSRLDVAWFEQREQK